MTPSSAPPARLRAALREGPSLVGGCFDALSARLAERAGFGILHLSGFGVEVTQIGGPDLGLTTLTELASHAARVTSTVEVPIIADVDTGFGGVLNVRRTISEMERAGVAGVHIEDQAMPKRCPLLGGRRVLSRGEAVDRVSAACEARRNRDFLIVARTDADVVSIDEVIERSNLYLRAGADVAMPMSLLMDGQPFAELNPDQQMTLLARLARDIDGPLMTGGAPPPPGYTARDVAELGYQLVLFASAALGAAANAMAALYAAILREGTDAGYLAANPGAYHDGYELMRAVHLDDYQALEQRHTSIC
ncbi:oxaloacetate decarboxylase [Amycolatopsis sp. GM8]|uniref:isocitrate lyase/PEP mutase family protein n=1 Tax=Amycolatopsis sp. GM8 TaxID=2896530 RepID=UPI001F30FA08|nr:isocitrate lyase/PEP mutase family protein [Amycolatopsis sp. GM8]